jgi:4-hydroxy 2-oxovalerate aldolase
MKKIYLLDTTLRDGGYVNDFKFNYNKVFNIVSSLQDSNIDIIECGILGDNNTDAQLTKFNSLEEANCILPKQSGNCMFAIMLNYAEKDLFSFKEYNGSGIEIIRLAFFKSDWYDALKYAKKLINLGYKVFLQAMATSMYDTSDLIKLLYVVNEIKPFAFYIVDSFGTLNNKNITSLFYDIDYLLNKDIIFGFHGHNNQQLAFANTVKFIELAKERKVSIDSSVFGMGRGAGNCATELISQYLNNCYLKRYNVTKLLEIHKDYISKIYEENGWGYSIEYFLTACRDINPAYIWYMKNKNITDVDLINKILDLIPEESKYFLDKNCIDNIIRNVCDS